MVLRPEVSLLLLLLPVLHLFLDLMLRIMNCLPLEVQQGVSLLLLPAHCPVVLDHLQVLGHPLVPDLLGQKEPDPLGQKEPDSPGQKAPDPLGQKAPDPLGQRAPDPLGQKAPDLPGQKALDHPDHKAKE